MDMFSDRHITYLYFIGTVIHLSYVTFTENYVHLFDLLPAISSGKVRDLFFCLQSCFPEQNEIKIAVSRAAQRCVSNCFLELI